MIFDRQSLLDDAIGKYCPWRAVASGLSDYFGWIATGSVAVLNAYLL